MKIERGLETAGLRLSLTIHSVDGDAHSAMSDNAELFQLFADRVAEAGREALQKTVYRMKAIVHVCIFCSGKSYGEEIHQCPDGGAAMRAARRKKNSR